MLVWEPGEAWAPVERWIVYEMMTLERAPQIGISEDLKGPPPRRFGRYVEGFGFKRTRSFTVSQRQWDIYQDTGLYGRPLWIVQGRHGGHKRFWSDLEQNLIRMYLNEPDLECDPPAPGDLAYAEPDDRTITALAGMDLVRMYGDILRYQSEATLSDALDRREREVGQAMAEKLWGWMRAQVEESLDVLTRKLANAIWEDADPDAKEPDQDKGKAEFVESVGATVSL